MKATEFLLGSLCGSHDFAMALLRDLSDSPLARSGPDVGPHAHWIAGHLVLAEAAVLDQYLEGHPHRFSGLINSFGIGTSPKDPQDDWPEYELLLDDLERLRGETVSKLTAMEDSALTLPCHDHDWPGPKFETIGACLSGLAVHTMYHAGQVACIRQRLGRTPLFL